MEWEYATESWVFVGPGTDDWPGAAEWTNEQGQAAVGTFNLQADKPRTERAQALRTDYYEWRNAQESEWLNTMGTAGYELVAVYRHEDWEVGPGLSRWFAIVTVFCYFKRPRMQDEDLPTKPQIGFRPRT